MELSSMCVRIPTFQRSMLPSSSETSAS